MTLLMRDQENIEIGMEKGIKKDIEKGKVYGAIFMCRDLGLSEAEIIRKLHEKFQLSQEEAEQYMLDNGNA